MSGTTKRSAAGSEAAAPAGAQGAAPTRRSMLLILGMSLTSVASALFAVPLLGYFLSPAKRRNMRDALSWVSLGPLDAFPEGQTRLTEFRNPFNRPWDGPTADIPCWVRRVSEETFQVFAINCAHLGCPVRWFPQSGLFLCPCHGGAYYQDGSRAAGPPDRGLFEYKYKIEGGALWIMAGMMPTMGSVKRAAAASRGTETPCV